MVALGRIVKSNSHTDLVAQVYGRREVPAAPSPDDYAFGTFVRVPVAGNTELVAIVYDTLLLNPEFGVVGPRLVGREEVEIFAPDYLDEKTVLLGLFVAGESRLGPDGRRQYSQEVPPVTAEVDAEVHRMGDEDVAEFHRHEARLTVSYFPRLASHGSPVVSSLQIRILQHLGPYFPEEGRLLRVLARNIQWHATMGVAR